MIKYSRRLWKKLEDKLWAKVLIGLFAGLVLGISMGPDLELLPYDKALTIAHWIAFPGYFFLAIMQMIVIPLVISSVICGIACGNTLANVRKLGIKIVLYFLLTTSIAVTVGASLTTWIAPGDTMDTTLLMETMPDIDRPETNNALLDNTNIPKRIAGLLPRNPFSSLAGGEMLQIVLFAVILGMALLALKKEKSKPLLDLMTSTQEACMVVVNWLMKLAPWAVFGLITELGAKMGIYSLLSMASYMGVVIGGLLIMVILYMLILTLVAKRNPIEFLRAIKEAQLIAFSTSSSAATMPVTLQVAEEHLKIKPEVSRFVIPLGTTINMDGTALYQTVAAIFLAQIFGIDLGMGAMLAILVTAIAASVGTPGTPGVGIVVLATILVTIGVPVEGIGIIFGVDRILDMCRTTVNVTGDLVAASVMDRHSKPKKAKQS